MALLKEPDNGVAVTVTLPDPPDVMVMEEGSVPKVRFASTVLPPQLEVNFTGPEIRLTMLGFPTAFTYKT